MEYAEKYSQVPPSVFVDNKGNHIDGANAGTSQPIKPYNPPNPTTPGPSAPVPTRQKNDVNESAPLTKKEDKDRTILWLIGGSACFLLFMAAR